MFQFFKTKVICRKTQFIILVMLFCLWILIARKSQNNDTKLIYIAMASCGSSRIDESFNMIKSSLINTKSNIYFFIFTERENEKFFNREKWPYYIRKKLTFEIIEPKFPDSKEIDWKQMYAPCSSQRLFLPSILKKVDRVLYIDSDSLVMKDLQILWNYFETFDNSQIIGVVAEAEQESLSYYNENMTIPFYGKSGFNNGVLLMNLEKMRQFQLNEKLIPLAKKYKNLKWGDQCLLNAVMHYHSDKVKLIDCLWNFRLEHCRFPISKCQSALENGIGILHGSRQVFKSKINFDEPIYMATYQLFDQFDFSIMNSKVSQIFNKLLTDNQVTNEYCGRYKELFIKSINHLK